MRLAHLVVATDGSLPAQHAALMASVLASKVGGRLSAVTAVSTPGRVGADTGTLSAVGLNRLAEIEEIAYGIPSVEIPRFAEDHGADLLILGRRPHQNGSGDTPIRDTSDAVTRRSQLPCLIVPQTVSRFDEVWAALDGTERGMLVLCPAAEFAQSIGATLHAITVEAGLGGHEEAGRDLPASMGSVRIATALGHTQVQPILNVRRGDVIEEVIKELSAHPNHVLAIGTRRGGPAGRSGGTGVGRRLIATAPGAVLTIPI